METVKQLRATAAQSTKDSLTQDTERDTRELQGCGEDGGRSTHCFSPEEQEVYSSPVATQSPSMATTANAAVQPTVCPTQSPSVIPTTTVPTIAPTIVPTTTVPTRRPTMRPTRPPTSGQANYEYTTPPIEFTKAPVAFAGLETVNPTFAPQTEIPTFASSSVTTEVPTVESSFREVPTQAPNSDRTDETEGNNNFIPAFSFPTLHPSSAISGNGNGDHSSTSDTTSSNNNNNNNGESSTMSPTDSLLPGDAITLAPTQMKSNNENSNANPKIPTTTTVTQAPTIIDSSETDNTENANSLQCTSNSQGNFGVAIHEDKTGDNESSDHSVILVEYQYQVETLPKFDVSVEDLNVYMLQSVEKAISDILVKAFFPPSSGHICLTPVVPATSNTANTTSDNDSSSVVNTATALKRGGQRRQLLANGINSTSAVEIVGLAAKPADQVMEGDENGEVLCPFPVGGAAGCYVIDGGLSISAKTADASDDLSWIGSMVQAELEEAMNGGALDNLEAAISTVRYIPLGTELATSNSNSDSTKGDGADTAVTDSVQTDKDGGNTALSSAPVWSWILGGFGFVGLAVLVIVGFAAYKRRHRDDNLNDSDSPTKRLASRERGSPTKRRHRSPVKGLGSFPVNPMEIVDDNSELDEAEIYQDSDDDDNDPEQTGKSKPMSWRKVPEPHSDEENKEFTRLEINATDPNQPVVRPVLDEESETYINGVV